MTTLPAFEVSYDYLCPFARIAHLHLVEALKGGAAFDVTFTPWTLLQVHKDEGAPDVWDDDARPDALIALEASVAVRDALPERFLDVHRALFDARHVDNTKLDTRESVASVLDKVGVDATEVFSIVDAGATRKEVAASWRRLTEDHAAFGVPTFIVGDDAVFVRLMAVPTSADDATTTIESVVRLLVDSPQLNEFKHTKIAR